MIGIIDINIGNVDSVSRALKYIDVQHEISSNLDFLNKCSKLIFPGVGNFSEAVKRMEEFGLAQFLNEKIIKQQTPLLGICLGMQLMSRYGTESVQKGEPLLNGLNFIDSTVVKIITPNRDFRVPHVGWNDVRHFEGPLFENIKQNSAFYFTHSYVCEVKEEIKVATTNHGVDLVAAFNKNNVYGVQFHPEKSQKDGLQLLKNFINLC